MRSALVPILLADPMPWAFKAPYAWDFLRDRARFAGGYKGALSNTPNWTFTRASTGYAQTSGGVLQSFASGELRRTDKGVLIEGARTNLCLQSQTFDNASWTKDRCAVSADAVAGPDGTSTADKVTEDSTASNTHRIYQNVTTAATPHTFSICAKAGTRAWLYLRVNNDAAGTPYAWFNLSNGTIGTVNSTLTASITALANGWYRCTVTVTNAIGGTNGCMFGLATGDGITSYNGDGSSYLYLWGAQLEATAFASSYVATTTASATRAADSLTVTGVTGLDYPLTLYAEFERAAITGAASETYLAVDPAASTNEAFLYVGGTNLATVYSENGSTQQAAVTVAGATTTGVVYKMAARIATDSVQIARGGTLGTEDTVGTVPSAPSVIRFGSRNASGAEPYGYLRRAAIYASAKTDAQLQALTT